MHTLVLPQNVCMPWCCPIMCAHPGATPTFVRALVLQAVEEIHALKEALYKEQGRVREMVQQLSKLSGKVGAAAGARLLTPCPPAITPCPPAICPTGSARCGQEDGLAGLFWCTLSVKTFGPCIHGQVSSCPLLCCSASRT